MSDKELKRCKGNIKIYIKFFEDIKAFVDEKLETAKASEIRLRLDELVSKRAECIKCQVHLESLDENEIDSDTRSIVDNFYFSLRPTLEDRLDELKAQQKCKGNFKVEDLSLIPKLPEIKLDRFSGDIMKWRCFLESFDTHVHNNARLSDLTKFQYLKNSLEGIAAKTIENLDFASINYEEARRILIERFDRQNYIVEEHVRSLFTIKPIEELTSQNLLGLLDEFNSHLRSLKNLGRPTEYWDDLIIHLIVSKLDSNSKSKWREDAPANALPTFEDLSKFIRNRSHSIEGQTLNLNSSNSKSIQNSSQSSKSKQSNSSKSQSKSYFKNSFHVNRFTCIYCKKDGHSIMRCHQFLALSIDDRIKTVRALQSCENCLKPNHNLSNCPSTDTCRFCKSKHHSLLHLPSNTTPTLPQSHLPNLPSNTSSKQQPSTSTACLTQSTVMSVSSTNYVMLATAEVLVVSQNGNFVNARAMLDSGSQLNFITKSLASKLGLQPSSSALVIRGIGCSSLPSTGSAIITIKSKFNDYSTNFEVQILSKISNNLPDCNIDVSQWVIPSNITLADPHFNKCQKIDMLIGADLFFELQSVGQIKLGHGLPILQKTQLGWIISGRIEHSLPIGTHCHLVELNSSEYLNNLLQRFWESDEQAEIVDISTNPCEQHFKSTHQRNIEGRFIVRLPFIQTPPGLGNSSVMALKRFINLESRLNRDVELRKIYHAFISEYISMGHMSLEPHPSPVNYYLPHHCVFKPDSTTTALRVVFDGSAKSSNGQSVNSLLMNGPVVQNELSSILLRFRTHKVAFSSDISKMYRQVMLHPDDQRYQYIFWRFNSQDTIKTYKLQTVTYGTTSAPFLATRCLLELANENERHDPIASAAIKYDMYVDDLLTGTNSVEEAINVRRNVTKILENGGMPLRKWCSNDESALEGIAIDDREKVLYFDETEYIKTLGLYWHSGKDCFRINVSPSQNSTKVTKRMIVSEVAKIYDPIGLVSPVVMIGKMFMQELWKLRYDWDESLPLQIHTAWMKYRSELEHLKHLYIPRHLFDNSPLPSFIQLHGFSDASEKGYGAALYIRSKTHSGFCVRLLCSKSRVAPIKTKLTLPRLELCAATLLAELIEKFKSIANFPISEIYCWSDSTIVLHWLNSDASRWSRYVGNRVQRIQSIVLPRQWLHVDTKHNPADIVSRGAQPKALIDLKIWWEGPEFLALEDEHWHKPFLATDVNNVPEIKRSAISLAAITNLRDDGVNYIEDIVNQFTRKNSLLMLQNSMAYILRYISNSRIPRPQRTIGPLSCSEVKIGLSKLISQSQKICFPDEHAGLMKSNYVVKNAALKSLSLFIDNDNIIRVGGRLKFSTLSYTSKHPALLHTKHYLTTTIISHLHKSNLHVGAQGLLAIVRQDYWPIHGRRICKTVCNSCVICSRAKPKLMQQVMADLPSERVNQALPFVFTAVDYCGPFMVHYHSRGRGPSKAYLACFVCMVTRAVHLELTSAMTTEAFMGTLKRFIATRGLPKRILSDNGSNFIGANNHMHELFTLLTSSNLAKALHHVTISEKIEWDFIPPSSPHFGGLHEAAVKSAKHHLRRLTYNARFTFEEFSTIIKQVEAVLNSRPLVPLVSDSIEVLTPSHFLIGRSMMSIPETAEFDPNVPLLKKWELVTSLHKQFWLSWSKEYLQQLQQRKYWSETHPDLKENQIVIIKDDHLPPLQWKIGRVLKVHPGSDGHVRVATIKTASGEVTRAIAKIAVLPVNIEPASQFNAGEDEEASHDTAQHTTTTTQ